MNQEEAMAAESPATVQMPVTGGAASVGASVTPGAPPTLGGKRRIGEMLLQWALAACALVSVITTFGIIYVLVSESLPFFRQIPITQFLTGREWTPQYEPPHYGVLPLICGTLLVTAGA